MTDEDIRKAACEAWDAAGVGVMWGAERSTAQAVAVFRAGMEAGRAEAAAAKPKRRKAAIPASYGFTRFWEVWPASPRKGGKAACQKIWDDSGLEAFEVEIFWHVQAMRVSQDWLKDNGAFIPMPATYLNQRRWDGAEMPSGPVAAPESARAREARERVERVAPGAAARRPGSQEPTAADWIEYVGTQITG